jgi:hypothetical protein
LGLEVALLELNGLAENVNLSAYEEVPSSKLLIVSFVRRIELFHEILCIFDNNLVGLTVQTILNVDEVLLADLYPPGSEAQTLDLV